MGIHEMSSADGERVVIGHFASTNHSSIPIRFGQSPGQAGEEKAKVEYFKNCNHKWLLSIEDDMPTGRGDSWSINNILTNIEPVSIEMRRCLSENTRKREFPLQLNENTNPFPPI